VRACAGGRACVVVSIDAFVTAKRWFGSGVGVKCCEERNASFKQESIGGKEGTKQGSSLQLQLKGIGDNVC
jgi:hypothetical protein